MTSIGKNPSSTLAKDKAKIEYISEEQPSPYELAFGIKLGPNPNSKNW